MLFGYARCSITKNNPQRQVDALIKYGVPEKNIYVEKYTGTKQSRPKINKLREILRPNDTVVVSELSRLSRNVQHTFELVNWFKDNDIRFVAIAEGIDTDLPISTVLLACLSAVNEMRVEEINEAAQAGREIAKREGRMGRKIKDPDAVEKACRMYETGKYSVKEIAIETGLSSATIYRHIKKNNITLKCDNIESL